MRKYFFYFVMTALFLHIGGSIYAADDVQPGLARKRPRDTGLTLALIPPEKETPEKKGKTATEGKEAATGKDEVEAKKLFEEARAYEGKREGIQALKLYKQAASKGSIGGQLRVANNSLKKLQKIIKEKQEALEGGEDKLGSPKKKLLKLEEMSSMKMKIFDLAEQECELMHEIEILKDSIKQGVTFCDPPGHLKFPEEEDPFMAAELPEKEVKLTADMLEKAIKHLQWKKSALGKNSAQINDLERRLREASARKLVRSIQATTKFAAYIDYLAKIENFLKTSDFEQKKLRICQAIKNYDLLRLDKKYGLDPESFLATIRNSVDLKHMVSPILFEELREVRDTFLIVLGDHAIQAEEDSSNILRFAHYFMIVADSALVIIDPIDRLKMSMIALKEAGRYLEALSDPASYVRLVNPERYAMIEQGPEGKRAGLYRKDYSQSLDFDISVSSEVRYGLVKQRQVKYAVWFLNESYKPYKDLFFSDMISQERIRDFLSFAATYRAKLSRMTFLGMERGLKSEGRFIDPPYTGDPTQVVWVSRNKAENYSIRVKRSPVQFTIGFLRKHPYVFNRQGVLQINTNGSPRLEPAEVLIPQGKKGSGRVQDHFMIDERENEILKFYSYNGFNLVIPAGLAQMYSDCWDGSGNAPDHIRSQLMNNAHF
jgi:hypothetical protein